MRKVPFAAALVIAGLVVTRLIRPRFTVADKVVIVTGGSRGLGLEIAREAARRGAKIGLCARLEGELEAARTELARGGTAVATAVCDVRDEASVARAFAKLSSALGQIDVLVNCAGIITAGPIEALTLGDFRDAMETNFFGALRTIFTVLPGMRARGAGRIVNITSIGGELPVPHLLPYCASKFAFVGFSEGLRTEVARDGVKIVTVIPGLMRTGSPPHATFAGQSQKEYGLFVLADATPATSVSVAHAARLIVRGAERGDARVVISWQAKLGRFAYGIAPDLVIKVLEIVGFALPDGGEMPEHRSGFESESALTESPLTAMSRHASQTQHETVPSGGTAPEPQTGLGTTSPGSS